MNENWTLTNLEDGTTYPTSLPTCNYLVLQQAGVIPDPLIEENEDKVQWVSHVPWQFSSEFELSKELYSNPNIHIVFEQIDTLGEVYINDSRVANVSNAHILYDFDIKDYVKFGKNTVKVILRPPYDYVAQKQAEYPLPNTVMGERGNPHLRKPQYHWSWDWGPHMVSAGLTRPVYLYAYTFCKITDMRVSQKHIKNQVHLSINTELNGDTKGVCFEYTLTTPRGDEEIFLSRDSHVEYAINEPELWWCNGMGKQPLYTLSCRLLRDDHVLDTHSMRLGLRSLVLVTHKDKFGDNFCFRLNGYEVFARGANWIASDAFVNQTSPQKLRYLIFQAKSAGMNILRVWGGSYYESNDFYDLCDEMGIMVWQDFAFACSPFNWYEPSFLASVEQEVRSNVKRLRHHACLCLWCGNNEIEAIQFRWMYNRELIRNCKRFYYDTLPTWLKSCDDITSYWPGSPCSGTFGRHLNTDKAGDTHLWQVWHGLKPLDYLTKRFPRFCSEFGLESLPSYNALDIFAKDSDLDFNSPVMQVHQKCLSGNERMLYYVLSRFYMPENFRDIALLTQLTQMEYIKGTIEQWRRYKGRCNGAIYWQFNDCWGVNSWSGMDYYGNLKALMYHARTFNAPITASLVYQKRYAEVYLLNDSLSNANVTLSCTLGTFDGEILMHEEEKVIAKRQNCVKVKAYKLKDIEGFATKQCYFAIRLFAADGSLLCTQSLLFKPEKKLMLSTDTLTYDIGRDGDDMLITLHASAFTRYIELRAKGICEPFNDNYFDMLPNETRSLRIRVPNMTVEDFGKAFSVRSIADIAPADGALKYKLQRMKIFFKPYNFFCWIYRSFD